MYNVKEERMQENSLGKYKSSIKGLFFPAFFLSNNLFHKTVLTWYVKNNNN